MIQHGSALIIVVSAFTPTEFMEHDGPSTTTFVLPTSAPASRPTAMDSSTPANLPGSSQIAGNSVSPSDSSQPNRAAPNTTGRNVSCACRLGMCQQIVDVTKQRLDTDGFVLGLPVWMVLTSQDLEQNNLSAN